MALSSKRSWIDELLAWPGVTRHPHRFGGIELRFDGREIGHLHGERLADLLFPKPVRDRLLAEGRAKPHHIVPDSGWVSFYIDSEEDIVQAVELFRLKYDLMTAKRNERSAGEET
ncbi:luciferase family protein [Paenibacillus flagellatus]|uniref:Luciferase domain-containing protein n=1 Tax=Paenibacillus flagellatus TaxID=2211139 RepID=A0A2V5KX42_9BACL|nr:luciferase family protein [Paenibacillus flagellatus]PYI54326.1 hypothetical protein DLM86_12685 [Paenibacillus flagellatus]